jgi:hypothetical protein
MRTTQPVHDMVLHTESSIIDLSFIKFVYDGAGFNCRRSARSKTALWEVSTPVIAECKFLF